MAEITAGAGCADRANTTGSYTFVTDIPWTDNGTCDEMSVYLQAGGADVKFSMFTISGGDDITKIPDAAVPFTKAAAGGGCLLAQAPGDFTAFSVTTSMYPGSYSTLQQDYALSGGTGVYYVSGDQTEASGVDTTKDEDGLDSYYCTGETAGAAAAPTAALAGPLAGPFGGPI